MNLFDLLDMVCGLALFLYGMHVMGEGLSRASGGKLEGILERLTNSRIRAVLLGAAVTAVIQSSSATTVMVVGFVNSGIMKLSQAVGVIMGANIGTTITSWILSLTGIESSNLLLRLCKQTARKSRKRVCNAQTDNSRNNRINRRRFYHIGIVACCTNGKTELRFQKQRQKQHHADNCNKRNNKRLLTL